MKIIAFIIDPKIIRAILIHLALWDTPKPRPPPPPALDMPIELEYVPCEE
jgi:hypothetical protein